MEDLSELKCVVAWSIGWFLGFTLMLCWSIYQMPDDTGGCGFNAAWVPEVFCTEACLIPFCPVVFAMPSILWPVTLVVLILQHIEYCCRHHFAHMRKVVSAEVHEMREAKHLLPDDEESCLGGFQEEGSIALSDLSDDSPRSSDETLRQLPYHMRATKAIRKQFSSRFRSMPYQPIPPATPTF